MWSVVEPPIDAMIAALSGSTALDAIDRFQAFPAGKGRPIGARTTGLLPAAVVVAAFVLAAVVAEADVLALGLMLGDSEALGDGVSTLGEDSALTETSGSVAL